MRFHIIKGTERNFLELLKNIPKQTPQPEGKNVRTWLLCWNSSFEEEEWYYWWIGLSRRNSSRQRYPLNSLYCFLTIAYRISTSPVHYLVQPLIPPPMCARTCQQQLRQWHTKVWKRGGKRCAKIRGLEELHSAKGHLRTKANDNKRSFYVHNNWNWRIKN